jgi:hypothetical protein
MKSASNSCQILMRIEFSWQIFEKYPNIIKCYENSSNWSRVVACGQPDGQADNRHGETNIHCRSFANAPKNAGIRICKGEVKVKVTL